MTRDNGGGARKHLRGYLAPNLTNVSPVPGDRHSASYFSTDRASLDQNKRDVGVNHYRCLATIRISEYNDLYRYLQSVLFGAVDDKYQMEIIKITEIEVCFNV